MKDGGKPMGPSTNVQAALARTVHGKGIASCPFDTPLGVLLGSHTAASPDAPAVTFEGASISYSEYDRRTNRLARFLQHKGVGPEALVGVCAYRSIELVVALHAIIKAGGAYLPLDPALPARRLALIIEDSRVPVVLAQKSCANLLQRIPAEVIFFDEIEDRLQSFPDRSPETSVGPDNLAYVIYTSGSTGDPKGVLNTHKGIVNRLIWMRETFNIGPFDSFVQKTPFSFDVSVWELFLPLMCGARLVIARPEGHKDADYLSELVYSEKITIIHFVPSMLRFFLDVANQERCSSLRHVILSGEALTIDLQRRYFETLCAPLHNLYGPTEAAVDVSHFPCDPAREGHRVPIGKPISNTALYILDPDGRPVAEGQSGELHIGGIQVARGYLNRPELTAQRFIADPFTSDPAARLYKTGDVCRFLPDGTIDYLGRRDFQVKIRGNRIELGEIEAAILRDESVRTCAVAVREDVPGEKRLAAYVVGRPGRLSISALRERLALELPDYMIPAFFVAMNDLPLTTSGKIDRNALPRPGRQRPELANRLIVPRSTVEKILADSWCRVLQLDSVGIEDNFFELGGDSLTALRLCANLLAENGIKIPVIKLFEFPTIARLAEFLGKQESSHAFADDVKERAIRRRIGRYQNDRDKDGVAIIGMAGRFPGAETLDQLWTNLCTGVESISFFTRGELRMGLPEEQINDPDYVPARGFIEGADRFDAAFFGIGPLEAALMDPQQRVFLELAWCALENAGYDPETFGGTIGVYAGVGDNHYYQNVLDHPDLVRAVGPMIVGYGNEKDYIATRVSYALNLTGPSISANTGCSTTLLAVDQAFHALLDHECDMALAGGVDIHVPQKSGFLYQPDGIFSRDGHCRPFAHNATGTLFCDGAAIVVLKRLDAARADGDHIYAVLRGSAKNNDGAGKASFLAPSVEGQAKVVAMAMAHANVAPDDISYVEAHGTGTPLGDPIEIEALTRAFRLGTEKKQFCRIGSIKGNIGHPTIASGVAGLIKAALCLYHERIPATLHFEKPNERIDFANSPFSVADTLTPWPRSSRPRIAGVSSFGFGGTNVHTIVSEAPAENPSGPSRAAQLILISANTAAALERASANLKSFLLEKATCHFADLAYTLQVGRRHRAHRRFIVCRDLPDAMRMLSKPDPLRTSTRVCTERNPGCIFMFPGQGAQYPGMGKSFYNDEPTFRSIVDRCCEIVQANAGCDLKEYLFKDYSDAGEADRSLGDTFFAQPALFTIEYALARLLQHWGIEPAAMIGHSVGEFVCACLSGVLSMEDALQLVAARGRLIRELPAGSMLSVRSAADEIQGRLPKDIQVAAANSPALSVVSGPIDSIARFEAELKMEGIPCAKLHTSHAFHSAMMDPVVKRFSSEVARVELNAPRVPYISSVTGDWITDGEARDPTYWGRHLRMPVRFSDGIRRLIFSGILLEVGPRRTCTLLARQHGEPQQLKAVATMGDISSEQAEWIALLNALGYLWANGVTLNWRTFYEHEKRKRVPLPTYPFERKRFWVDKKVQNAARAPCRTTCEEEIPVRLPGRSECSDPLNRYLTECLEEICGLDGSGIDPAATFLEMGLDSLSLSQIANKIMHRFNVKVNFSQLMGELSCVSLLAEYLRKRRLSDKALPDTGAESRAQAICSAATWPMTLPQKGLWASSKLSRESSCAYNESVSISLTGAVDQDLLEKAIRGLVRKHDALRTTFSEDGRMMTIADKAEPDLRWIDLRHLSIAAAHAQCEAAIRRDIANEFDLGKGPLMRCHLMILPGEQHHILMTLHHIICDGWSLDVLVSDMCAFYCRLMIGQPPGTNTKYTFAEFCRDHNARGHTEAYLHAREYWKRRYAEGFPSLRLPRDNIPGRIGAWTARRIDWQVDSGVADALRVMCKSKNWSLFSIWVAAFNLMLYRASAQKNFIIGLPIAGQPLKGQLDLVGHCSDLIALSCSVRDGITYEEYIESVQRNLLEAYANRSYTYIDLLADAPLVDAPARPTALSAGLTNTKRNEVDRPSIPNVAVAYFPNPKAFESFELYLNVIESKSGIELLCHYRTELFAEETIRGWLKSYEATLNRFTAELSAPIMPTRANPVEDHSVIAPAPSRNIPQLETIIRRMLPLWRTILRNPGLTIHDNFFYAGGNSLLAARLVEAHSRMFDRLLPVSTILQAPTIAQFAQFVLRNRKQLQGQSLVEIKPQGSMPPLFLIHSEEGSVIEYSHLAHHLQTSHPVYGLQAQGMVGDILMHKTIPEMAAHYIEAIRERFPQGPYHLGGYCLGGMIAFEMCHQLEKRNEEVPFLCLISTATKAYLNNYKPGMNWISRKYGLAKIRVGFELDNFLYHQKQSMSGYFMMRLRKLLLISLLKAGDRFGCAGMHRFLNSGLSHAYRMEKLKGCHRKAYFDYILPIIRSRIILIRPKKQPPGIFEDRTLGLGAHAFKGVLDFEVDCYHKNILLEPHVRAVAAKLERHLHEDIDRSTRRIGSTQSRLIEA